MWIILSWHGGSERLLRERYRYKESEWRRDGGEKREKEIVPVNRAIRREKG